MSVIRRPRDRKKDRPGSNLPDTAAAEVLSAEDRPRRDQSRYRTSSHLPRAPNAVLSDVAATPQSE